MCKTYLFEMWSFFIHARFLNILRGYFTEFMTSFVWFKFSHMQLDTPLKTLLKHDSENYICYFTPICRLIKHKPTIV
jgi:hypothetical protein